MHENPLSKTTFRLTKDRLQHYSTELFQCEGCGESYQPKVHSQPYVLQVGIILVVALVLILVRSSAPPYFAWVIGASSVAFLAFYYYKDRRIVTQDGEMKIRYGDIILECPKCKSTKARWAEH